MGESYAMMTDAVTKNLATEETIAKALDSSHISLHLESYF